MDNPKDTSIQYTSFVFSEIKPSLISEDHCSEGLLLTMPSGKIWHFFRMHPGVKGDHVGVGGAIYKRYSENNAETWSTPELVYDDPNYDDRNIAGGMTDEGDVIIFFRRFGDISGYSGKTKDINYLISHDYGETFSDRIELKGTNKRPMRFVSKKDGTYLLSLFEDDLKSELRTFKVTGDDVILSDYHYVFDNLDGISLEEPEAIYLNGKVLCVFRNYHSTGLSQAYSEDDGVSFSGPMKTNAIDELPVSLPCMFYDSYYTNKIWLIVGDRRDAEREDSSLKVFSKQLDETAATANNWNLCKTIKRPAPTDYYLYGYPTITMMKNGKYLIVFSEANKDSDNTENADLYQFTLSPIE